MQSPLFKAAQPILENLSVEIERSMNFYLSNLGYSNAIDNIVLCGGGSNMKGLLPYLTKRLNQSVEFGDPWVNIQLGRTLPPIDRGHSVQYSTAIGLALRGLDEYADLT
jgi:Tfp pilus assembly PilM family ATPase